MFMNDEALAQAPKSRREALQRALDYYAKFNYFATEGYGTSAGDRDVIGQFFTKEQIAYLRRHRLNDADIYTVALKVGGDNIEAMTGLDYATLEVIQQVDWHHHHALLQVLAALLELESPPPV